MNTPTEYTSQLGKPNYDRLHTQNGADRAPYAKFFLNY